MVGFWGQRFLFLNQPERLTAIRGPIQMVGALSWMRPLVMASSLLTDNQPKAGFSVSSTKLSLLPLGGAVVLLTVEASPLAGGLLCG